MARRIVLDPESVRRELGDDAAQLLLEIANELVNQLRVESPVGATGDLQNSWQIFRRADGKVVLGSRLSYALAVNDGRPPHTPEWEAIQVWARRKLNDESAAGPVFRSIQQHGTSANPYIDRALDNAIERF